MSYSLFSVCLFICCFFLALSKRFSEQPGNTSVWQGDNVRFSCQSEKSIPPATITWEKDGVPIVHSNDKITLLSGVLQITSATIADEGMYRCILSNGIKQRYSQEGFLKVLSGMYRCHYNKDVIDLFEKWRLLISIN